MSTEDDALAPPPPRTMAPLRQTAAVKDIMLKVISLQSTNKYAGQIDTFALFCNHSDKLRDILLEPWFIEEIGSFATEYAKQRYVNVCCIKMCPDDDNCPFILSNQSIAQFSDFVTQRKARRGGN